MSQPATQRCPSCGMQPMSRLQYLFVPGTRSKCRQCGARIRVRVTRRQLAGLVLVGALLGWFMVSWDTVAELVGAVLLGLVAAWALDEWGWRNLPWRLDQPAAPGSATEATEKEAARV